MLKMIDVVGVSDKGYSEAVENAIKELTEKGNTVHFFKVKEPRGSFHNGKIEYQVVLTVAIEE